ncbi:MAG: winged helix-turn-helix domain-containing protein [Lachnospiraceae bacterium]|nr:winged helix-turn-helix domain-containing protein [Lachnospiraceae bacterium]
MVLRNVNYNENQTGSRDSNGGINGGLKRGINGGLNETQQNIIGLISDNPLTTTQAIADSLNFTRRKVDYHISQLKRAGLVEREGAKKNGRWIVK